MQRFSKNWKQGAQELRIDGKLVVLGAATGLKKGGHDRGTSPYPFPMWVPPGRGAQVKLFIIKRRRTLHWTVPASSQNYSPI